MKTQEEKTKLLADFIDACVETNWNAWFDELKYCDKIGEVSDKDTMELYMPMDLFRNAGLSISFNGRGYNISDENGVVSTLKVFYDDSIMLPFSDVESLRQKVIYRIYEMDKIGLLVDRIYE